MIQTIFLNDFKQNIKFVIYVKTHLKTSSSYKAVVYYEVGTGVEAW